MATAGTACYPTVAVLQRRGRGRTYVQYKGVNMPRPCSMAVVVSYAGLTDALPPVLPYTRFPRLPITWGRASPITFTYCVLCYPPPAPPNRLPMQAYRGVAWPPSPPGARGHPCDLRGAQGRESEMWQMRGAGCRMRAVCIMCCVLQRCGIRSVHVHVYHKPHRRTRVRLQNRNRVHDTMCSSVKIPCHKLNVHVCIW